MQYTEVRPMCSTAIYFPPSFLVQYFKHVPCQAPALSTERGVAADSERNRDFLKQQFSMAADDSALCFSKGQTGRRKLKRTGIRWEFWKTKNLERENLKIAEKKIKQGRETGKIKLATNV